MSTLGDKMKAKEVSLRTYLEKKKYNVIRLDGKAFSKFTRQFKRPFDPKFIDAMDQVAKYLCEQIQGSKLGFVQSDEISIIFTDKDTEDTDLWFQGAIQKIVSVAAAMASVKFNHVLPTDSLAVFDARLLQFDTLEEVQDYFTWRQGDCRKNSIGMLADSLYSHKELDKKNSKEKISMIIEKGQDWNDFPMSQRQGRMIRKVGKSLPFTHPKTLEQGQVYRSLWSIVDAPNLDKQDFDQLLKIQSEE